MASATQAGQLLQVLVASRLLQAMSMQEQQAAWAELTAHLLPVLQAMHLLRAVQERQAYHQLQALLST